MHSQPDEKYLYFDETIYLFSPFFWCAGPSATAIAARGLKAPRSHRVLDAQRCILSLI